MSRYEGKQLIHKQVLGLIDTLKPKILEYVRQNPGVTVDANLFAALEIDWNNKDHKTAFDMSLAFLGEISVLEQTS